MAPVRQAVVLLLFQCALIIHATEQDGKNRELSERFKPQIYALLDHLNAEPYREYNYRIYEYVNSAQKTDEILDVEIKVGADCLDRNKCARAVLFCRGYVEYFPDGDTYRALPDPECHAVWFEGANEVAETSTSVEDNQAFDRTPCYGCGERINEKAEGVDTLLRLALDHVESERNKKHSIVEVVSLHRQVVAGVKFTLLVKIAPTLCPNDASLINPELCPIDQNAVPEYCKIVFFQKPTFSTDDHIVSNNCTRSQEFSPVKPKDDSDNEINGYQRPEGVDTIGPNFEQISQSGSLDGLTAERLAALEAQIIPTGASQLDSDVEATRSVIDNTQMGVEDIPSMQSSTDGIVQNADMQRNDNVQRSQILTQQDFSHEDDSVLPLIFPEDPYDDTARTKRQAPAAKSSESSESSEEAAKRAAAAAATEDAETTTEIPQEKVKRQAPEQSSESSEETAKPAQLVKRQAPKQSSESSEEETAKPAQVVKRQAVPKQSSESSEEETAKPAQLVKRQAPKQSSESSEEDTPKPAQPVKRQAPKQSSESSEEEAPKPAQIVKRQAAPKQSSESSEEGAPKPAQLVKRQAPKQSSESSEEETKPAQPVKRQAPKSSESSEEATNAPERVKRAAKDSSSSSSSSSDEDNNNNHKNGDDDDDDDNGKEKPKQKKKHGKQDANDGDDDDNNGKGNEKKSSKLKNGDNNNGNGNGDDSSSSSSSDEENGNGNGKNRRRRAANNDDASSSSSDDDDGNKEDAKQKDNKTRKEEINEPNDDSSSSSSDEDGKREKRELVKPNSDEKLVVRKVAEFAAKSLDDVTYEHKLLKIESVKKLAFEGTIYHIRIRVAVLKCNTVCANDGEKLCKLKVYVSPNGVMEVNKSHCHRIIAEADKNRTDRLFEGDSDEVDAFKDERVKELLGLGLGRLDRDAPDETRFEVAAVEEANKRTLHGSTLYKVKVKVVLTDCLERKSAEFCGVLSNTGKACEFVAPFEDEKFSEDALYVKCAERAKRQVPGGVSDARLDERVIVLTKSSLLLADTQSPHDNKFKVLEILKATKQVVAGMKYKIKARVAISDCAKNDQREPEECGQLEAVAPRLCDIIIWDKPWLGPKARETTVKCGDDVYSFPRDHVLKRSIPGGLRDIEPALADELMSATVLHLDPHTPQENKYKVVNIVEAHQQVVQGMQYKIKANLIVSDCLENDARPAHECGELKTAKPQLCNVVIWDRPWLPLGRRTTVDCGEKHYSFNNEHPDHKLSKRETLVGAPQSANNDEIAELLSSTMLELDARSAHDNKYKIVKVINATTQVVSGSLHEITVAMSLSDCAKTDTKPYTECGALSAEPDICVIEIWDQPWLANARKTNIKCPSENYKFTTNSKKLAKRGGLGAPSKPRKELIDSLLATTMVELDARTPHDNKYTVVQVLDATQQTVSGFLYEITAEMGLSDCLKTDDKPYHECRVLKEQKPEICKISIIDQSWLPNGRKTSVKCPSQTYKFATEAPRKIAKRAVLVGAPIDNTENKELLSTAMVELDAHTPHANKYKVVSVLNSTKQIVSGIRYNITAELVLSDCKKGDSKGSHECGVLNGAEPQVCNIIIWDQPWLENAKKTTVHCPPEKYEFTTNSKPRTKRHMPGSEIDTTDPLITELTKSTLLYLDSHSPHDVKYKIQEILTARKQIASGTKYNIKAKIILSDCKKYDSKDPVYCNEQKTATPRICDIKIWDQPWENHGRKTNITCDTETYQYRTGRSSSNLLGRDDHDFHYSAFRKFVKEHNKDYKSKGEYKRRFKVFVENMKKVAVLEKNEQGTAIYGASKFADLTEEEFKAYLGYRPEMRAENEVPFAQATIPDIELPKEFDWRKKGVVTEVKNQEQCGSCWAFSVTGNIEGQYALKYQKLLEFSEQELVDCDKMDDGCNGGLMDNAYRAIEKMGGLELESDYPYDAKDESCHFNRTMSRVQLSGAVNISHDETDMAKWLVQNGPISIALNANAMQFYMGGVSHPLKFLCNPNSLDHGVLIVGYGVHKYPLFNRTLPYWIVKNSWGTTWGEQGYYRVYRGDGTCGLNQTPSSAIVA